ncbi:hypothetical protein N0V93_008574 [Gnomoniopsis smithogilvyi]|uniref:Carboxylic ester hydrolase n=1 Tax=Gnomoniopsis smithogilvyi TaxID=1191159 RepID=A0A9W8YN05_9PEZI|nr:hypothetical protein N0V93_008574 [Gnomoniopsis smithogilvyi]
MRIHTTSLNLVLGAVVGLATPSSETMPIVDLGYGVYQGYYNSTSSLNIFKGIRYAASPTGSLRWQKPQSPQMSRSETTLATQYPSACPQSPEGPLADQYNFTVSGNEDCLFVSVFAAPGADSLPVMVWIHGGGYGTGQGNNEFWELLDSNNNGFVLVLIQYRLGAFGFLSSEDLVSHGGVPNVGIHDMRFSLEWVKSHINKFGGDPEQVTVAGESAGGGAVMLLTMANGGTEGTSLFTKAITASPYLPQQWDFDGAEPTQAYNQFAAQAGCVDALGHGFNNQSVLDCLTLMDTTVLQNASAHVSGGYKYGQWAFVPVTDSQLISGRPSVQLNAGNVNGLRMLTSNNADEGQGFTPQNITSATDFEEFVTWLFPLMTGEDRGRVLEAYSIPPVIEGPLFSSFGDHGPTALNQSEFGIGQQQRANNLYAETTFICPSYWLANAFSSTTIQASKNESTKKAWKYQFSVPPSEHGADLDAYQAFNREALGLGTMTEVARKAVQFAWGRFIIYGDPSLPESLVDSLVEMDNGTATGDDIYAITTGNWTEWSQASDGSRMLNVNMTGGVPDVIKWTPVGAATINITQMINPGLEARFRIVNAETWEGGRGERCKLWQDLGATVPE